MKKSRKYFKKLKMSLCKYCVENENEIVLKKFESKK